MSVFDEIVRTDNKDLLECIYGYYKSKERDLDMEGGYSLLHLAAGGDSLHCLEYIL